MSEETEIKHGDLVIVETVGLRYNATLFDLSNEKRQKVEEYRDLHGISTVNCQLTYVEPHWGQISGTEGLCTFILWEPFGLVKARYLIVSPVPNVDSVVPKLREIITSKEKK